MKQSVRMEQIQHEMQPGVITRDGFLGSDRRPLSEILDEDDAEVKRLGYSHASIAARMRELREAGRRGLGLAIRVAPHFDVRVDGVRGRLPCPFGHAGVFPKTNITVTNQRTGRTVIYTDLSIHMIERHGFYEGEGSPFRIAPRDLAETIEPLPASD